MVVLMVMIVDFIDELKFRRDVNALMAALENMTYEQWQEIADRLEEARVELTPEAEASLKAKFMPTNP